MVGIEGRKLEEQGRKKESGSMNGLKHKHDPKKEGSCFSGLTIRQYHSLIHDGGFDSLIR